MEEVKNGMGSLSIEVIYIMDAFVIGVSPFFVVGRIILGISPDDTEN